MVTPKIEDEAQELKRLETRMMNLSSKKDSEDIKTLKTVWEELRKCATTADVKFSDRADLLVEEGENKCKGVQRQVAKLCEKFHIKLTDPDLDIISKFISPSSVWSQILSVIAPTGGQYMF